MDDVRAPQSTLITPWWCSGGHNRHVLMVRPDLLTSVFSQTYTERLRGVELKLSCMTAIDEHSPHHIWRRDGLNILHQRQLDLLATKMKTEEGVTFSRLFSAMFDAF